LQEKKIKFNISTIAITCTSEKIQKELFFPEFLSIFSSGLLVSNFSSFTLTFYYFVTRKGIPFSVCFTFKVC